MTIYTIYKITNIVNGKGYIGFDSNWPNRKTEHITNAFTRILKNPLYNSIRKYGIDQFEFEILYQSKDSYYTLNVMENKFIIEHNTFIKNGYGYNQTLGGGGMLGYEHSHETKQKISTSLQGRTVSEETRKKISDSKLGENHPLYGKTLSKETKQKISTSLQGRTVSKETRKKQSESQLGEKSINFGKVGKDSPSSKHYEITTPSGEIIIIHGMTQFCRENNLNQSHMCQTARGLRGHHKQYRCRLL